MTCREYREAHPDEAPAARAHLAGCADCRAFREAWELLRDYPPAAPSAGFIQGLRRKLAPPIIRFAAAVSAAAAALLVAAVVLQAPAPRVAAVPEATDEERELVENLDLLENYELLRTLELVGENGSPLQEEKR